MELKDTPIISDAAGLFLVLMIIGAYIWVAHLEWDLPALEPFFVFSLGALVGGILVRWVIDEENKKQKQKRILRTKKRKKMNFSTNVSLQWQKVLLEKNIMQN